MIMTAAAAPLEPGRTVITTAAAAPLEHGRTMIVKRIRTMKGNGTRDPIGFHDHHHDHGEGLGGTCISS
jgi:hypothetical protein